MFSLATSGMTAREREDWWKRKGREAYEGRSFKGQAEVSGARGLRYKSIACWLEICLARNRKPSPNARQWYKQGGFVA